jgi:glycosyltransferase involved in cell wall biosynthesis
VKVCLVEFSGKGAMIHYNYHLGRALQRSGIDTTLVTSKTYELRNLAHNFRVVELLDLWDPHRTVTRNRLWRETRRLLRGIRFAAGWVQMVRFLRQEKPDVIVIGIIRFAFEYIFLLALRLSGFHLVEVVHDVHTFDHRPGKPILRESKAHTRQYNQIYALFDALFVHDRTNRREFLELYRLPAERVYAIPLPASDMLLELKPDRTADELRRDFNIAPGQKVVLFFGTLNKYKGVEILIQAFPAIYHATGARLVIAGFPGKDIDPNALQALAADLGIGDQIAWCLEYFPNERVASLMKIANVVVYPYRMITQSGALKVAYLFGKPVVASRVGGLPDVVEDGGTGFLVAPEDPDALAEAVIRILRDPQLARQMGQRGKFLSETQYSWCTVAERMKAVFETVGDL